MIMIISQEQKRQQQHIRVFFYCLHQTFSFYFSKSKKNYCYYQKRSAPFYCNIYILFFAGFFNFCFACKNILKLCCSLIVSPTLLGFQNSIEDENLYFIFHSKFRLFDICLNIILFRIELIFFQTVWHH